VLVNILLIVRWSTYFTKAAKSHHAKMSNERP
jgi:hypothetical protein